MKDTFKNLKELITNFQDEDKCRKYLAYQRWGNKPVCPYCQHDKIWNIEAGRRYKCAGCKKKFSVTVGTILEDSNIPISTWFAAIYLCTSHKKGISSVQLGKDLGITQKTAWFMEHRIREMLKDKNPSLLKGRIQVDECYIGGENKNRHYKDRIEHTTGRATRDKTPVIGLIEEGGRVRAFVVPNTKLPNIQPLMRRNMAKDATIITDAYNIYMWLDKEYNHVTVKHIGGAYVVDGNHTQNIENFWSLFKRGLIGIYHYISPKHLQRYCEEFSARYNTRKLSENERFNTFLAQVAGRLTYPQLIGRK